MVPRMFEPLKFDCTCTAHSGSSRSTLAFKMFLANSADDIME